ncbi:MAG: glycoside hydrolase family 9 protein [Patescibacteria group bacterium]
MPRIKPLAPLPTKPGAVKSKSQTTFLLAVLFASFSMAFSAFTITNIDLSQPPGQVKFEMASNTPDSVQVQNVTSKSASLTWPAMTDATGYNIYIAPEPDLLNSTSTSKLVATVPGTARTYTVDNMAANAWVFVRVQGVGTDQYYDSAFKTKGGYSIATGGVDGKLNIALASPLRSVSLVAPNVMQLVLENKNVISTSTSITVKPGEVNPRTGKINTKTTNRPAEIPNNSSEIKNYTGQAWQAGPWTITRRDGSTITVNKIYRDSVSTGQWDFQSFGANNNNSVDVDHNIYLVLDKNIGQNDILSISGPLGLSFTLPFSDKYLETPVIQLNQVGYSPRATERYAYISWWMGDGGALKLDNFPSSAKAFIVPNEDKTKTLSFAEQSVRGFFTNSSEPSAPAINLPITSRLNGAIDADAGGPVNQINLAPLTANDGASYRLYVPGVGVSYLTQVSEYATLKAFYIIMRGLYLNRWGRDLQPQWTDWATHAPDHPYVWKTATTTFIGGGGASFFPGYYANETTEFKDLLKDQANKIALSGGHHDAGDFDQNMSHFLIALYLMRAYEVNPTAFTDNQLTIPESGNGIPDLLDEALYELKAWEQLQDISYDGGIPAGVEALSHPTTVLFAEDEKDLKTNGNINNPYFVYSKSVGHTLRIGAEFAQVSRLVAPFDSAKAAKLKERAIKAYDWALVTNDATITEKNYYGSVLYISGELYKLTGETKYKDEFYKIYKANSNQIKNPSWSDKWNIAKNNYATLYSGNALFPETGKPEALNPFYDFLAAYLTSPETDANIVSNVKNKLAAQAGVEVNNIKTLRAYRNGRPTNQGVGWGMGAHASRYVNEVYIDKQLNPTSPTSTDYFNAMSLSADYILGANPLGRVWFTGLGTRPPLQVLHNDSLVSVKTGQGQMPGIPVYGPVGEIGSMPYYFPPRNVTYPVMDVRPPMWEFVDARTHVTTNEFTIQEVQAPDAELFAALLKPGLMPPSSWLPGQANHQNPYPTAGVTATSLPAPANVTAAAINDSSIKLSWSPSVGSIPVLWYKVYRDGVFLDTTKGTNYTDTGLAESSMHTYAISVVSIYMTETKSQSVTGRSTGDTVGPQAISANALSSARRVSVVFNESVDKVSAEKTANYSISPTLAITAASLSADGKTVNLTVADQQVGATYALAYSNIYDKAATPNKASGSISFKPAWEPIATEKKPVFNGESPVGFTVLSAGAFSTGNSFQGAYALEGLTDSWHLAPAIRAVSGTINYRSNISGYEYIMFWAKAQSAGDSVKFYIASWDGVTDKVEINNPQYIPGGQLATTYKLVKIPISAFGASDSAKKALTQSQDFLFEMTKASIGHKIYIDDIWLTKGDSTPLDSAGVCQTQSCTQLGKTCGSVDNGCGTTLNCGTCASGSTCAGGACVALCGNGSIDSGEDCDGANLNSQTCASVKGAGYTGTLSCDSSCRLVSTSCVAPCVAKTCGSRVCGTIDNGCGTTLSCGSCSSGSACNSNGACEVVPPACTAKTCAQLEKTCGSVDNGCGTTINCGTCATGSTCTNGVCVATPSPGVCTTNTCCKAKNSTYPYYNTLRLKCCMKPSTFFTSCIAP